MKQKLRLLLGNTASYLELVLALFIIIGILFSLVGLAQDCIRMFHALTSDVEILDAYNIFFSFARQLVIAVEFVKMLVRHTPESVVEVLLFVIARKITVSHSSGASELLIGVVAIAILLLLKYFLFNPRKNKSSSRVFNSATMVEDFNRITGIHISPEYGNTLGGVIHHFLDEENLTAVEGRTIVADDVSLRIKTMENGWITDVEVIQK